MIKRSRGRTNIPRPHSMNKAPNGSSSIDERNEIRLKPRNYYQQQHDKYMNLARESLRSGDRVDAELHFQYAEHYYRQLNERIRYDTEQQQQQQQKMQQKEVERQQRFKQHRPPQEGDTPDFPQGDNESYQGFNDNGIEQSVDGKQKLSPKRRSPRNFYKRNRDEYSAADNESRVTESSSHDTE